MATKTRDTDTAVLDHPGEPVVADQSPVMLIGMGRGQTGKSCFTRWAIDRARNAGREVIPADGDRSNATLTSYYKDAARPRSAHDPDVFEWITGLIEKMALDRTSVALDLGGGDRTLEAYSREFPLLEFCQEDGIRLVRAEQHPRVGVRRHTPDRRQLLALPRVERAQRDELHRLPPRPELREGGQVLRLRDATRSEQRDSHRRARRELRIE